MLWQHFVPFFFFFSENILIYWHMLYLVKLSASSSCLKAGTGPHSISIPHFVHRAISMFYWPWWPTILGPMRMGYGIVECPKKLSLGGMVALYILIRTVDSILLWQLRNTLQCTESYFGIDVFLVPFASSTTVRLEYKGWHADGRLGLKEKKENAIRPNPDLLVV